MILYPTIRRMMICTTTSSISNKKSLSTISVAIALSGGVDSSVAAALLLEKNNETFHSSRDKNKKGGLIGIHMSNWSADDDDSIQQSGACTADADWKDSIAVARHLQIPIVRRSFESDYWCHVFEPYVDNIARGIMGNPDIACNTHVKFGALLKHCKTMYGDDVKLATGHYARLWYRQQSSTKLFVNGKQQREDIPDCVEESECISASYIDWLRSWGDDPLLLAAADNTKDQSYFLAGCQSKAFRHVLFPLGDYYKKYKQSFVDSKPTVREIASSLHLPSASKRDSMGICFVGKRQAGFRSFVYDYLSAPQQKLQFVDIDTGEILYQTPAPQHAAIFSPGQSARISGRPTKYFIVDNGITRNKERDVPLPYHTVTVCAGTHHPALYSDRLYLSYIHWLASEPPPQMLKSKSSCMRVQCRIRHLQPLVDCTLIIDNEARYAATVVFDVPVRGITSGQTAVFYCGLVCLGSGPIATAGASYFEQGRLLPDALHPAGHNDLSSIVQQELVEEETA